MTSQTIALVAVALLATAPPAHALVAAPAARPRRRALPSPTALRYLDEPIHDVAEEGPAEPTTLGRVFLNGVTVQQRRGHRESKDDRAKRNPGGPGPRRQKPRSFRIFQEALERGEAMLPMPVEAAEARCLQSDEPKWDNSDIRGAEEESWLRSDVRERAAAPAPSAASPRHASGPLDRLGPEPGTSSAAADAIPGRAPRGAVQSPSPRSRCPLEGRRLRALRRRGSRLLALPSSVASLWLRAQTIGEEDRRLYFEFVRAQNSDR